MARKRTYKPASYIENIMKISAMTIGVHISDDKLRLLSRLFISGIADRFFEHPDDIVDMGFLRFEKSPDKDELFKVMIIRNSDIGIVNAGSMWKYYKGELTQGKEFKKIFDSFLSELINYSKEQELEITKLTSDIQKRKGEK
jgi:hypothetical protein